MASYFLCMEDKPHHKLKFTICGHIKDPFLNVFRKLYFSLFFICYQGCIVVKPLVAIFLRSFCILTRLIALCSKLHNNLNLPGNISSKCLKGDVKSSKNGECLNGYTINGLFEKKILHF